jgi:hypothetical protein
VQKSVVDSEVAAKHLDRILGFFSHVEAKASFLFAIDSLLGLIVTNVQRNDFVVWYYLVTLALAAVLFCASLYFVYRCIFPCSKEARLGKAS